MKITDVKKATARFFKISPGYLDRVSRRRDIVLPRQVAHYICYELNLGTTEDIGNGIGRSNYSTVIHSHRVIANMIDTNFIHKGWKMKDIIEYIKKRLTYSSRVPQKCYKIINYDFSTHQGQFVKKLF